VAPAAMLFYCLIGRGGILDGWAGFYYAFQRALAEMMLSLYLIDHDLSEAERPAQDHNQRINANAPPMNTDKVDHKETDAQRPIQGSAVT
jgi:hypothetical protein